MNPLACISTPDLIAELASRGEIVAQTTDHLPAVVQQAVEAVAVAFDVAEEDLIGRSQRPRIARARHAAWGILAAGMLSRSDIGRTFGRDYATIMHGIARCQEHIAKDPAFSAAVDRALAILNPPVAPPAATETLTI